MALQRQFVMATGWRNTGFYVRGVGHFIISGPEYTKRADFSEIFWCISGEGFFADADGEHVLRPGYVWYYPPGSIHKFYAKKGEFNYRWLSIEGPDCGKIFQSLRIQPGITYADECPEQCFAEIELALKDGTPQSQMSALASAIKILTCITAPAAEKKPSLEKAKEIMHNNYQNPELNIAKIADLLHIHRVTLSHSFKAIYGMTAGEYLTSIRLQAGIRLLMENKLSIKEIALRCGFASGSYFGKVLMNRTGHTPKSFQHHKVLIP